MFHVIETCQISEHLFLYNTYIKVKNYMQNKIDASLKDKLPLSLLLQIRRKRRWLRRSFKRVEKASGL